ncbi:nucleotidyltransferase domain-containing protein [Paenibacillus sp. J2TS4]|uniref:nucleotidyltransferase domain-containing protein n=1 Tax=Paenibacillus sp. J2TS4 TaxID=2807194 RepID=UPI001AFFFDEF|nr:nucleotidyltransferase domain-containing protein [Paenibacillus sp. J2TS4]GIP34674.1 hypothetical protein J2TS4_38840 [Paenibacillus sp. J2TS4]
MNEEIYLANWRTILENRAEEVASRFRQIPGVRALILGGSLGRGEPWPLSDIDIIPIYDNNHEDEANERIKELRAELVQEWEQAGWRTALDVGTLYFNVEMVSRVVDSRPDDLDSLLDNVSCYHCLDKAYRGRPLVDPDGVGSDLVRWFNAHRFAGHVVSLRKSKLAKSFAVSLTKSDQSIADQKHLAATFYLNEAVEHLRTYLLESWGERDHSFARLGTRFERLARAKQQEHLADQINQMKSFDDEAVLYRLSVSPDWIRNRHRLSYKCRRSIGEELTEVQDARDVLRVFARYEMKNLWDQPLETYPDWLGIVGSIEEARHRYEGLQRLGDEILSV